MEEKTKQAIKQVVRPMLIGIRNDIKTLNNNLRNIIKTSWQKKPTKNK
jgi:hypothetical protein